MSKRIAVLCSGGGTNLQALIDAVEAGSIDGEIVLVLANASKAFALERARRHGIPAEFISKKQAGSDEAFNDVILQRLRGERRSRRAGGLSAHRGAADCAGV